MECIVKQPSLTPYSCDCQPNDRGEEVLQYQIECDYVVQEVQM